MIGTALTLYIATIALFVSKHDKPTTGFAATIAATMLALLGAAAEVGARYLWGMFHAA